MLWENNLSEDGRGAEEWAGTHNATSMPLSPNAHREEEEQQQYQSISRYSALQDTVAYQNYVQLEWEDFLAYLGSRPSDVLAARHRDTPRKVDRVTIPLPLDVDPECRIEIRNKHTGDVGFQLTNKLHNADRRIVAINETVELADELLFAPMQFVDRAVFPGEENHIRPTRTMPNRWERVTLGVMLATIIHKQYEWSKQLSGDLAHLWELDDPLWKEWAKEPSTIEALWVTALRRTLPAGNGRVYWFPEIEMRFK
ncbi:hypothetical protein L226DRAFT_576654 [Lentinus tigrinus ALCF2SS1-7]|uniref:Uncharacterized protein n=1 Tax=Lentinus tigrinus ALCF2SS1-6 TaxID=1328759 RepID=A0A5C2RNL0_9APHY|nr:hypothetical protein L227DRAFT_617423 [Lentinus tigrinus ALCF2SS1-6]RPD68133.1 hypothetical protein L226DRAFT_576654 [Lentinus tigrinus ALCF2SS1-7]